MRAWFWLRWGLRDLRARWPVVLATGLVLAIGTGLFATMGAMKEWRIASADASFAALHGHDLRVALTDGSFARSGQLRRVALGVEGIGEAQERLSVPTQVEVRRDGGSLLVTGELVGVPVAAAPIDGVAAWKGRTLTTADAGRPVAVLDRSFGQYHDLAAAGRLRVGGRALDYVGLGMSPDWFIVSRASSVWGAEASFAVVFASLPTAQAVAGHEGEVDELVVRLAPGADLGATEAALDRALKRELPRLGFEITRQEDEQAHRFLYRDAENDQRVFLVFASLMLLGAALGAFNLVSRVVEAQRREIGIGMALGVAPWRLGVRPLLLALQVAVLGSALGVGIAIGTAELFKPLLDDMLPLPEIRTPFMWTFFSIGVGLGLLVPVAAAALPVWRGVRVTPIEAIRVGFRTSRGAGLAGALRRVPVPGGSLAQMPLRNVLRAPRRTVMTVLGVASVIAVVVSLGGMIDSFDDAVGEARAEARHGAPDRIEVVLDTPRPAGGSVIAGIAGAPVVADAEPRLRLPGVVAHGDTSIEVSLELVDAGARLWRPRVPEGSFPAGTRGILLARRAAEDLGVSVGDEVTLRHPVRSGPGTLGAATTRVPVAGIHGSPFRPVAVLDAGWARRMGLAGAANVVEVTPAPGHGVRDVQDALFGRPGIASVEAGEAGPKALADAMDRFGGVLQIGWLFALALAVLMAFNATSISAEERTREHATMFAFGLRPRVVLRIDVLENLVLGVLATAAGLALGVGILHWIVGSLVSETMPDLGLGAIVSSGTLVAAGLAGLLALGLAPLLTARRLRRMDVPSALRVME